MSEEKVEVYACHRFHYRSNLLTVVGKCGDGMEEEWKMVNVY
jgi:hypothetical protein